MGEEIDPEVIFTPVQDIIAKLQEILDELITLNTAIAKLTFTGVNSVLTIHETTPT